MSDFMSQHPHPSPQAVIDEARTRYLRTFCDVYYPQIVDLAENKNEDAINLLVFSGRKELQTPKPAELGTQDYWASMQELEPLLTTPSGQ